MRVKESLVKERIKISKVAVTVSDSTLVMLRRKEIARELEFSMRRNPPVVVKVPQEEFRGNTPIPAPSVPVSEYSAIVIPSGEGKSMLCKERPEYFYDIDDLGKLPFKTVSMKRGDAYFSVETRDFSSVKWKVLLVGNRSQVPDQYQLIKEYALCECRSSHPHTGGLKLFRSGSVRYNTVDRQTLGSNVSCCSSFETRNTEILAFLRKVGFCMGAAKHAVYLRSKPLVSNEVKTESKDRACESELVKKLKAQLKVGVVPSVSVIDHDDVSVSDPCVSQKPPGFLSFFKGYRSGK